MTLAEQLRHAIKQDGKRPGRSMRKLALDAGVDPGVVSRFVRGERDIGIDVAGRLAAELGLVLRRRGK